MKIGTNGTHMHSMTCDMHGAQGGFPSVREPSQTPVLSPQQRPRMNGTPYGRICVPLRQASTAHPSRLHHAFSDSAPSDRGTLSCRDGRRGTLSCRAVCHPLRLALSRQTRTRFHLWRNGRAAGSRRGRGSLARGLMAFRRVPLLPHDRAAKRAHELRGTLAVHVTGAPQRHAPLAPGLDAPPRPAVHF